MNLSIVVAVVAVILVAFLVTRGVAGVFKFTAKVAVWGMLVVALIVGFYLFGQSQPQDEHSLRDAPAVHIPSPGDRFP